MKDEEQIKQDAVSFLRDNNAMVVATSFNDEPHASTVYYYMDNEFNFYFITKRNTSKYINVGVNARVAFVIGFGPEHITVQGSGIAEIVTDDQEREKAFEKIMSIRAHEHVKIWPIEEIEKFKDGTRVLFRISAQKVMFMNLDSTKYPESINTAFTEVFVRPQQH